MTANLRKISRMGNTANRCMTLDEALGELTVLAQSYGGDALIMCESWPVKEFKVYEDDEEDEKARCAPKIIAVVLDMTLPNQQGWTGTNEQLRAWDDALNRISGSPTTDPKEGGE